MLAGTFHVYPYVFTWTSHSLKQENVVVDWGTFPTWSPNNMLDKFLIKVTKIVISDIYKHRKSCLKFVVGTKHISWIRRETGRIIYSEST